MSTNIYEAVKEYIQAVHNIHVMHSSTDVHHNGGVAGQALTPHCAWECRDTGNYVTVNEKDGSLTVHKGTPPHEKELKALQEAGANNG